jgi:ubiquinol-cytochrome c reductase subunit 7
MLIGPSALSPTNCYQRKNRRSQKRYASALWAPYALCPKTNTGISQDILYLTPIIREIEAEKKEREDLESMVIKRRAA